MAQVLAAAAPSARLLLAPSAAEGEAHLSVAEVVILADRLRPAYLRAPRLRWLHIIGAGVDGFSITGLRDVPYPVTHKVEASIMPMAEHVMAQILLIARRALEYRAFQTETRLPHYRGDLSTGTLARDARRGRLRGDHGPIDRCHTRVDR